MKLLQLKHWQLFIITFALPFVAYLIGMIVFIIGMIRLDLNRNYGSPMPQPDVSSFLPLIIGGAIAMLGGIVHYIWMYKAGVRLQEFMSPEMRKLKVNRFKVFFFSPLAYAVLLAFLVPSVFSLQSADGHSPPAGFILFFVFMILGHFYAAFCGIFILYFIAKTIKSAELGREAHFSDYIGEFFLIWFYPIGIWFIQPRVNRIINDEVEIKQPIRREEDF